MQQNLEQVCSECNKAITWDEYVVNWASCSDCFNTSYEEYLRKTRFKRFWFWLKGLFKRESRDWPL